jgi:hypothetical protein
MTRRRIGMDERRARLMIRHGLTARNRAATPEAATEAVVALHATDPASVYLAAWARMKTSNVAAIERALYDDRTLVRMLGMRRTMFVVPLDLAPVVHASSTKAIAAQQRRLLAQTVEAAGIAKDGGKWLRQVEESTLRALAVRGEALAQELSTDEPRLRARLTQAEGKSYSATANISTRVLFLLAADGKIIRGRPRGSWVSGQYRWALPERWLRKEMTDWSVEAAQVALVRRWLRAFGPGRAADVQWWTGWTLGNVKRALAALDAVEVDLDGGTGFLLPDDVDPVRGGKPAAVLLPALDPTTMGWSGREWYLGGHGKSVFDNTGNAGPTVWWEGRVVGGWAQRNNGEVVLRLLEDIGREGQGAVETQAARLQKWIGSVRVTPRFRTPLERELSG